MRSLLMPVLYDNISLGSTNSCESALRMMSERPDVCKWIRKLSIRPNYYLAWPKDDRQIDEHWVAQRIAYIADRGWLHALFVFDWDGRELAPDCLWDALRDGYVVTPFVFISALDATNRCPVLHTVYSNVGYGPIDANSSLFTFRNLRAFSFTIRHGLEASAAERLLSPELEHLPQAMWDMLVDHCPNLQELNVCSFSPTIRLLDVSPVVTGHWPDLKCLVLGCFGYDDANPQLELNCDMDTVTEWVGKHEKLHVLRFVWSFRRWMSPDDLPLLPSVPLEFYAGLYQQIPLSSSSLTTLDLSMEPIADDRVAVLCPILRTLNNLEDLDIWLQVTSADFVGAILGACPKLKAFHYMSTARGDAVKGLEGLLVIHVPLLQTLSLTQGYNFRWRKGKMVKVAAGIARMNERVEVIHLRWVQKRCKGFLKQDGRYEVVKSMRALAAWERGFSLMGRVFSRQFNYPLH